MTFFCMKSEWEIGHIESSYSGRQRSVSGGKVAAGGKVLFLPLLREASTNARNVQFSIHFSTQKKGLFHACVKKKSVLLRDLDFFFLA